MQKYDQRRLKNEYFDVIWGRAFRLCSSKKTISVDSRVGKVFELENILMHLKKPRNRWIFSRKPTINIAFALASSMDKLSK